MEAFIEAILQILLEFFLQLFAETLAEFGVHCVSEMFERRPNPWIAAIGYAIFGITAGFFSVLIVPALIASPALRVANLIITPLAAGASMVLVGAWRRRRDQELIRLDRFAYGYLFALSMAGVRFWLAK